MFPKFGKKLEVAVKKFTTARLEKSKIDSGASTIGKEIDVNVWSNKNHQKHAVWLGGSMLAGNAEYHTRLVKTKAQYEEYGPNIMRESIVFGTTH